MFECEVYGLDSFLWEKDIVHFGVKNFDESVVWIDCVIVVVAHDQFKTMTLDRMGGFMVEAPILVDVRGMFERREAEEKGFCYLRL